MKHEGVIAGAVFEFPYPFKHGTFSECDEDGYATCACWEPGVHFENTPDGDTDSIAHGMGMQILTVVDRFRPKGFPERVFYTRKWQNPDGVTFGKGKLHITTTGCFVALIRGYRHEFWIRPEPLKMFRKVEPHS